MGYRRGQEHGRVRRRRQGSGEDGGVGYVERDTREGQGLGQWKEGIGLVRRKGQR